MIEPGATTPTHDAAPPSDATASGSAWDPKTARDRILAEASDQLDGAAKFLDDSLDVLTGVAAAHETDLATNGKFAGAALHFIPEWGGLRAEAQHAIAAIVNQNGAAIAAAATDKAKAGIAHGVLQVKALIGRAK